MPQTFTPERYNESVSATIDRLPQAISPALPPFTLNITISDPEQARDLLLALHGKDIAWHRLNGVYNVVYDALKGAELNPREMIAKGQQL